MKLWVARDKDGELYLYNYEPCKNKMSGRFTCGIKPNGEWSEEYELNSHLLPEVTFENSPQEIKLGLEKESIIKILKTYDNIFGLSDGGIARDEGDFEHIAEVIIKNM